MTVAVKCGHQALLLNFSKSKSLYAGPGDRSWSLMMPLSNAMKIESQAHMSPQCIPTHFQVETTRTYFIGLWSSL